MPDVLRKFLISLPPAPRARLLATNEMVSGAYFEQFSDVGCLLSSAAGVAETRTAYCLSGSGERLDAFWRFLQKELGVCDIGVLTAAFDIWCGAGGEVPQYIIREIHDCLMGEVVTEISPLKQAVGV